jgi:hypothetical protein
VRYIIDCHFKLKRETGSSYHLAIEIAKKFFGAESAVPEIRKKLSDEKDFATLTEYALAFLNIATAHVEGNYMSQEINERVAGFVDSSRIMDGMMNIMVAIDFDFHRPSPRSFLGYILSMNNKKTRMNENVASVVTLLLSSIMELSTKMRCYDMACAAVKLVLGKDTDVFHGDDRRIEVDGDVLAHLNKVSAERFDKFMLVRFLDGEEEKSLLETSLRTWGIKIKF